MAETGSEKPIICSTNSLGDIVCPSCGLNIIIPFGSVITDGVGACPICEGPFTVDPETATQANAIRGKTGAALTRIVRNFLRTGE